MFDKLPLKVLKSIIRHYNLNNKISMSKVINGERRQLTKKQLADELHKHLEINDRGEITYKNKESNFPIAKPEVKSKIEPELDIPTPTPAPENIIKIVNKINDKIDELQKEGAKVGGVFYDADTIISDILYIALLLKYEKKCAFITGNFNEFTAGITINSDFKNYINNNLFRDAQKISKALMNCIDRGEELIAIPLSLLFGISNIGHANMLFYRPFQKTVERYEPHGKEYGNSEKNNETFNKILKYFWEVAVKPYLKEYTPIFNEPSSICPYSRGFQSLESQIKGLKEEGGGFCSLWTLFVMELMFLNPELSSKEVFVEAINLTKHDPEYIKNIIRGYCIQVEKLLDEFIKKIGYLKGFQFSSEKKKNLIKSSRSLIFNELSKIIITFKNAPNIKKEIKEKIENYNLLNKELNKLDMDELEILYNRLTFKLLTKKEKLLSKVQLIKYFLNLVKDKKFKVFTENEIYDFIENYIMRRRADKKNEKQLNK